MSGNQNEPKNAPDAAALVKAETERTTQIAALCQQAGVPGLVSALISGGTTVEAAKATIEAEGTRVKAIRERVDAARKSYPMIDAALADQLIAAGTGADAASAEILNRITAIAAATPPTRGTHQATPPNDSQETKRLWDKVVDAHNERNFGKA